MMVKGYFPFLSFCQGWELRWSPQISGCSGSFLHTLRPAWKFFSLIVSHTVKQQAPLPVKNTDVLSWKNKNKPPPLLHKLKMRRERVKRQIQAHWFQYCPVDQSLFLSYCSTSLFVVNSMHIVCFPTKMLVIPSQIYKRTPPLLKKKTLEQIQASPPNIPFGGNHKLPCNVNQLPFLP